MVTKIKSLTCLNVICLLLFMLGMGVFLIGMPKYGDDLWFMRSFGDWLHTHGCDRFTDGVNVFRTGFPMKISSGTASATTPTAMHSGMLKNIGDARCGLPVRMCGVRRCSTCEVLM